MQSISPGSRVGPYEIVAPLGAGGMGEVWRGRDTRLDRSVAIKILPAEFAENAALKLRFEREARTISQLNHPNICTLYDVGDSYLVMELLEGESLADRLARGPLSINDVLKYGAQIAEALDKAHRAGIVHRDLKPGNVMITKSGAKLLDFGLAKTAVPAVSGDGATIHKSLTQEGTIVGTFQYMAPEQLEGEEADARTDIFALGALLYEMATGKRAFEGKTRTSLIASIVTSQPQPISQIQPLTPLAFEHVVQKCLVKDRDGRWQSAHDVAEELRWISEAGSQAGIAAPLTRKRKARERIAALAVIAIALAAGMLAARSSRLFPTAPLPQYELTIPAVDTDYRFANSIVIAPDGQTVLFSAVNNNNKRVLFRRRIDDFRAVVVEGAEGGAPLLAVAPDCKYLIIGIGGGVYKRLSINGGPTEQVGVAESGGAPAVASDGTILIGSGALDNPIRRLMANAPAEPVLSLDKDEVGQSWPVFLPHTTRRRWPFSASERERFLFVSAARDIARGSVHFTLCAASLGSKQVKRIGDVPSRVEYADGRIFFVREGTLMARPFDIDALAFTGEAVPVINDVAFSSRTGSAAFSVSRDGTIVCSRPTSAIHLVWVDATGKKIATVTNGVPLAGVPVGGGTRMAVTKQGDRVVLGLNDHHAGSAQLWIQNLTRDSSSRLTYSPALEAIPVLTPDGTHVFFTSDAQSAADIYEVPVDGSEPAKLVVSAPLLQVPSDVSPDGRFLLYVTNQNQTTAKQDLWILPLSGDRKPFPFVATPATENAGVFSPDGKWIAYCSDVTGQTQVYVRPFPGPGAARLVSSKGGTSPRFSHDGKRIYFNGGSLMTADFNAGSVSEPKVLFELADRIVTYEPVGDRFLMALVNDLEASVPARVIVNWRPPA